MGAGLFNAVFRGNLRGFDLKRSHPQPVDEVPSNVRSVCRDQASNNLAADPCPPPAFALDQAVALGSS